MKELDCDESKFGGFIKEKVYWLNTPGPIYTTQTDNCGTGQIEALGNVGGDENYYEFIFKQPYNRTELNQVMAAAYTDPLDGFFIDGNTYWTNDKIIKWWSKTDTIITYMIDRYSEELQLPANPHNSLWDLGNGPQEMHLYGPEKPLPQNYKSALDFYQFELKNYLEWYMEFNNGSSITLPELDYKWDTKIDLDEKLKDFKPKTKNLINEYENSQNIKKLELNNDKNLLTNNNNWNKFKTKLVKSEWKRYLLIALLMIIVKIIFKFIYK